MRLRFVTAMLAGCVVGIILPFVTPDHWWNLASMPFYVRWYTFPTDILFIQVCNVFQIDWLSDAADKTLLTIMQAISSGIVGMAYAIVVYGACSLVARLKRRPTLSGRSRDDRATDDSGEVQP